MTQKSYSLVILQGLVHNRGRSLNTHVANSGKVPDAKVLRRSGLYLQGKEGTLFPRNDVDLYGMSIPAVI